MPQLDSTTKEAPAPEAIGSDDGSVAKAIADLQEQPHNKPDGNVPENQPSGILSTILQSGQEEPEDVQEEPEEKPEDQEPTDLEIEEVRTDDIPVSKAIKDKFGRFKENEKKLRDRLAETEAKLKEIAEKAPDAQAPELPDIRETDEYKELAEKLSKAEEELGRMDIGASPEFKAQYEDKINAVLDQANPLIDTIESKEEADGVHAALLSALHIPTGEDARFYNTVSKVVSDSGMQDLLKSQVINKMIEARGLIKARQDAIDNWKDTQKKIQDTNARKTSEQVSNIVSTAKKIRANYESAAAERFGAYRDPAMKQVVDFDETTKPSRDTLESAVEASARGGAPTPELLALANDGTELKYHLELGRVMASVLQDAVSKNKELTARLKKYESGGTSGGGTPSPNGGTRTPSDDEKRSGILETMHEVRR